MSIQEQAARSLPAVDGPNESSGLMMVLAVIFLLMLVTVLVV